LKREVVIYSESDDDVSCSVI